MDVLPLIWGGIIAFGVIMYVLLGGFDIGIGILSIFFREESERDLLVSTILPVWDGNQTWLVFGGAALYGAFPLAFSTLLPMLYIPIFIMVISLLFRGISFEFRLKAIKTKKLWDACFFLGSVLAAAMQGMVLGAFVQGVAPDSHDPTQIIFHWFNPFSFMCALGLICGYVLLGVDYLIIKTQGPLQEKCFFIAKKMQYLIVAGFIVVSVWSPFLDTTIWQRWFNPIYMPFLAILPLLALVFFMTHRWALQNKKEHLPFWCVIGMFLMCYFGLIISIYPYIVPRQITYVAAAADHSSLIFMLVGACVMLPPLLLYTWHAYKIFEGKVTEKIGY